MKSLYCWSNQLTELDLSNNRKVESFIYDDDDVTVTGYEAKSGEEPTTEEKGSDATTEETPTEEKTESPKPTEEVTEDSGTTEIPTDPTTTEKETPTDPTTTEKETPSAPGTTEEKTTPDVTKESIVVSQVKAKPGDENVSVDVLVKKNPGLLALNMNIVYDDTALTLKDAKSGETFSYMEYLQGGGEFRNGIGFQWFTIDIKPEQIQDGVILTLTFDIPEDTAKGTYEITFKDPDIIIKENGEDKEGNFDIIAGSIIVE